MRRRLWAILVLLGVAGCGGPAGGGGVRLGEVKRATVSEPAGASGAPIASLPPAPDRPAAPGFEGATAWLNVDHPLTLAELRGRVVVVDFWTSCCINCLHTIPILQRLEERFAAEPVVVIGVHSPKFDEERKVGRLRDMIQAYGVAHPIAVDADMSVWESWGVEGWPTLAVLDVAGRVIWAGSGEPDPRELEAVVAGALEEGRAFKALARGPLPGIKPEAGPPGPLRYPGKVLALAGGGVAIADTGHNRVVLTSATGEVEAVIGSGRPELADGDYASAGFRGPQGMAEVGGDLYIADTGNHAVRRIDRAARTVTTVAGTGAIGAGLLGGAERAARSFALRSPWDVLHRGGVLYVALAGSHQIGALDLARGTVRVFAGTGQEARIDGPRLEAAFAQPSALATDGRELFVLDSETSSVRAIRWDSGAVRTVVGHDLFVFGDKDGDRQSARLQHPVGMAWSGGALWVADTYNGKLRRVDPQSGATRTALGGPEALGGVSLSEPGGVSAGGGALWIADTNRHRVVRVAQGGGAAAPIALSGLEPPSPGERPAAIRPGDPVVALGELPLAPGRATTVALRWALPAGTEVNAEAPVRLSWVRMRGLTALPAPVKVKGSDAARGLSFAVEPAAGAAGAELVGVLELVTCDGQHARVCLPVRRTVEATFAIAPGAGPAAAEIPLPPAE